MNRLEELLHKRPTPAEFAGRYLAYVTEVLAQIDHHEVAAFIQTLIDARLRGGRIFFIGNGGSASTASHFANDIGIGSRTWHKPFRAISLCENMSVLTALANDYSYAEVFVRPAHGPDAAGRCCRGDFGVRQLAQHRRKGAVRERPRRHGGSV